MFGLPITRTLLFVGAAAAGALYLAGHHHPPGAPQRPHPCTFTVTADVLNVRSGPGESQRRVDTLQQGQEVTATPTVTSGFRDLGAGRWAAQQYLAPKPGSPC